MSFFAILEQETSAERQMLFSVPQIREALAGRIRRETYLAYLAEAYHHVRHTVPLLSLARDRMDEDHILFRAALDGYIAEETGHDAWILNDIEACGGDPREARRRGARPATALMVGAAYRVLESANPMAVFGMIFVLEGTSVALATRGAKAVGAALGLGPECFSYLQSHGELDEDHLTFFAGLMAQVKAPEDQTAILRMAKLMFGLFADVFRGIPQTGLADAI
jgi:hypothetical protein